MICFIFRKSETRISKRNSIHCQIYNVSCFPHTEHRKNNGKIQWTFLLVNKFLLQWWGNWFSETNTTYVHIEMFLASLSFYLQMPEHHLTNLHSFIGLASQHKCSLNIFRSIASIKTNSLIAYHWCDSSFPLALSRFRFKSRLVH
jgi:hypothetical protein